MRTLASICRVLMWVLLAWMLFFQIGTIISIHNYDRAMDILSSYETGFMTLITVLMTAAVVLFAVLRRGKTVPLVAAAVLGVCFIWLAHSLQQYYGAPSGTETLEASLTVGKALYRHASPALLPVVMLPPWWVWREDRLEAAAAAEREPVPGVLGDLADFHLSALPDEDTRPNEAKKPRRRR